MVDEVLSTPALTDVDLTAAQLRVVRNVVDTLIPGMPVWVFGSRATGRARPFSDLDLLVTQTLSWAQRAALRDAFEASDLPFRVDVVEAAALTPGLAVRVETERLPLPVV